MSQSLWWPLPTTQKLSCSRQLRCSCSETTRICFTFMLQKVETSREMAVLPQLQERDTSVYPAERPHWGRAGADRYSTDKVQHQTEPAELDSSWKTCSLFHTQNGEEPSLQTPSSRLEGLQHLPAGISPRRGGCVQSTETPGVRVVCRGVNVRGEGSGISSCAFPVDGCTGCFFKC